MDATLYDWGNLCHENVREIILLNGKCEGKYRQVIYWLLFDSRRKRWHAATEWPTNEQERIMWVEDERRKSRFELKPISVTPTLHSALYNVECGEVSPCKVRGKSVGSHTTIYRRGLVMLFSAVNARNTYKLHQRNCWWRQCNLIHCMHCVELQLPKIWCRLPDYEIVSHLCYSVVDDKAFLWSKAEFDPPKKFVLPGPIITKLGMVDYVGNPYSYANFC